MRIEVQGGSLAEALDRAAEALRAEGVDDGGAVTLRIDATQAVTEEPVAESDAEVTDGADDTATDEVAAGDDDADEVDADEVEADDDADDDADEGGSAGDDADSGDEDDGDAEAPPSLEELDEEAEAAADFLEGLLDVLELPGNIHIRVHDDHAEVELVDVGGGMLIGRRGQTLDALQELVRAVVQRRLERRARILVDVEEYRARRLERIVERANEAIDEVLDTGEAVKLQPMDAYQRKAVHDLVASHEGVVSNSIGREPSRRVVIEPE